MTHIRCGQYINSIRKEGHKVVLATVPSGSSVTNFGFSIDATANSTLGGLAHWARCSWNHNEVRQNSRGWTETSTNQEKPLLFFIRTWNRGPTIDLATWVCSFLFNLPSLCIHISTYLKRILICCQLNTAKSRSSKQQVSLVLRTINWGRWGLWNLSPNSCTKLYTHFPLPFPYASMICHYNK